MKITIDDYSKLEDLINQTIEAFPGIKESYQDRQLSDERLRWDLLHLSRFNTNALYEYLNDDHIDTALRKITNTK
ncbi:hypothetical protein KAR91_44095 [Candidatus Pacearchaeota archaeon]|nr:hypothetical protein [Candidatus Pacearchaeota archaeon]